MPEYIQRLLRLRIVRYALVGGVGIPINDLALALFLSLMGDKLYPLALACSFEVSTTINFILNQHFTYHEQQHIRGWSWVRRALKAQVTSLSALAISFVVAFTLTTFLHVNPFIARPIGIIAAFFYNFFISRRFVFRPAPTPGQPSEDGTGTTGTPKQVEGIG
ncbi:MAG: hypothetical protein PVS3B1_24190 [Ktedonobacteraceae bacterium]